MTRKITKDPSAGIVAFGLHLPVSRQMNELDGIIRRSQHRA